MKSFCDAFAIEVLFIAKICTLLELLGPLRSAAISISNPAMPSPPPPSSQPFAMPSADGAAGSSTSDPRGGPDGSCPWQKRLPSAAASHGTEAGQSALVLQTVAQRC